MLTIKAFAKVNLFLKITKIRDDGYHELCSLFAFLDIADEIEISKASSYRLLVEGEFANQLDKDPANNILTRTLELFHQQFGVSKDLAIKLIKNIPIASGLGGGSSDAASLIKTLNQIYCLNLTIKQMQEISLRLGSDIAFFLQNQAGIFTGRGEIMIKAYDFKPLPAIIINPRINLSTKEIYQKFDQEYSKTIANKFDFEKYLASDIITLTKEVKNDLLEPALSVAPKIKEIIAEIAKQNGCIAAKMSGSGASCFGVFSSENDLKIAYNRLSEVFPLFFIKESKIYCSNI